MFSILSFKSIHQAKNSLGLISIKIRFKDLRTLTVWESMKDMKAFRNSGVHLKAMTDSERLGFNRSHTWHTNYIPSWEEAIARLDEKLAANNQI